MNVLLIQQNFEHDDNRLYQESYCLQRAFQTFSGFNCDIWGAGRENFKYPINLNNYDLIILLEQRRFDYVCQIFDQLKACRAYKMLLVIDSHSLGLGAFNHIKELGGFHIIL